MSVNPSAWLVIAGMILAVLYLTLIRPIRAARRHKQNPPVRIMSTKETMIRRRRSW